MRAAPQATSISPLPSNTAHKNSVPVPQCQTILVYVGLAVSATVLTFSCPGTRMWDRGFETEEQGTATLNQECLIQLILVLIALLVSFFIVQGSEPGYLNLERMNRACMVDHLNLAGEPLCEENGDVELQSLPSHSSGLSPLMDTPASHEQEQPLYHLQRQTHFYKSTRRKFCETCVFAPPLRSHHCRICNKCVATFDHHCHFIGTCIGERNHCRFWWFLTFQAIGFLTCVSIINSSSYSVQAGLSKLEAGAFIHIFARIYVFPLSVVAVVMWVTHSWLALSNSTTFEFRKGSAGRLEYLRNTKQCDLPFSANLDGNLRSFCCFRDQFSNYMVENVWTPIIWNPPFIVRDSEDCWEHPWQNKYYSCC